MRSYIGITVHFVSNYKLHNAMLAYLSHDHIPQLEEIVTNYEIINTSRAGVRYIRTSISA